MIENTKHNKGASVILGYSIMLGIGVVMIGLLLSAFGSQLQQQEQSAIETEMEIASGQIATEFEKADATIRNSNTPADIIIRPNFTDKTGEPGFTVQLDSTGQPNLYILRIEAQDTTVEKPFRSQLPVDTSTSANSTRLRIQYDNDDNHLQLVNRGEEDIVSIRNSIEVTGDYTIPDNSSREPAVSASGSILGGQSTSVHGYIDAGNDINTDSGIEVYDYARATNQVSMASDSYVQKFIEAGASISLGNQTAVGGYIETTSGTVSAGDDSSIGGDITAPNDVTIGAGGEVLGTIDSGAVVTLNDNVRVDGDVLVSTSSDIVCGDNVTINGKTCSQYKNDNY